MLGWTIPFLVIALIAAILGFGGIAGAAAGIAKILFFVFLVLFVTGLVMGRRRSVRFKAPAFPPRQAQVEHLFRPDLIPVDLH